MREREGRGEGGEGREREGGRGREREGGRERGRGEGGREGGKKVTVHVLKCIYCYFYFHIFIDNVRNPNKQMGRHYHYSICLWTE